MLKQAWVTLQRPPPLILTLDKSLLVFSTMITSVAGLIRATLTAQKKPAAPPPITNIFFFSIQSIFESGSFIFQYKASLQSLYSQCQKNYSTRTKIEH